MKIRFCCTFLLLFTCSCATMRRHPVITGVIAGVAIGGTVALATRHNCPHTINGVPYDGTPPCPKYWPDPGKK